MKLIITVEEFDASKGYLEYYLARELAKLGHVVFVFTFGSNKRILRERFDEGFDVIRIPPAMTTNGINLPGVKEIAYVAKFIRTERPDIVHCQPIDSPLSLVFILWSNVFKYKIVGPILTQLNLVFSPWNTRKKILFCLSRIVVSKYAAKKSETIFAKSSELKELISRSYGVPMSKFRIIPLGTDPELFKFDSNARSLLRKKLDLSASDVVIVYSGKLDSSKRLDLLIKALSHIITQNTKVKLLIIGTGKLLYVEYLKKLTFDLKISNNVIFHSWVDRKKLADFYSASDIAVWPGISSISIVEAASAGLPLVIADTPVEIYAVEDGNGFVFGLDDVDELQEYLRRLIDNEKMRGDMGRRSRLLVEKRLNWASVTTQYLDAYNHALRS